MNYFRVLIVVALSAGVTLALAQEGSGLRADVESGFGLRAGVDVRSRAFDYPYSLGSSPAAVESGLLLADWRPLASGFRLTGGLAYNNPGLESFGVAARSAWAPALDSTVAGSTLRSPLGRTSPYLGLGWGVAPTVRTGLYFSADVGLMYQRGAVGPCSAAMPPMLCMQLQNDLALEDDPRLAPVLTLG
ncbi:MAG: hypothetical protein ACREBN_02305, partial [Burkholderiaceae bacterium]